MAFDIPNNRLLLLLRRRDFHGTFQISRFVLPQEEEEIHRPLHLRRARNRNRYAAHIARQLRIAPPVPQIQIEFDSEFPRRSPIRSRFRHSHLADLGPPVDELHRRVAVPVPPKVCVPHREFCAHRRPERRARRSPGVDEVREIGGGEAEFGGSNLHHG